jgi:hypothetical protein
VHNGQHSTFLLQKLYFSGKVVHTYRNVVTLQGCVIARDCANAELLVSKWLQGCVIAWLRNGCVADVDCKLKNVHNIVNIFFFLEQFLILTTVECSNPIFKQDKRKFLVFRFVQFVFSKVPRCLVRPQNNITSNCPRPKIREQ